MRKQKLQQYDGPQETTGLLADTVRLAHNTEYIGDVTLEELRNQGDTLHDSRRNLMRIEDMTASAHESVRQLKQKIFERKVMLGTIILVLFVIIVIMLAIMYHNGGSLRPR